MQAYLKKHGQTFSNHSIKVNWERNGSSVTIEFQIQKRTGPAWQNDPVFTTEWLKNWGLWNIDVMEAFLQLRTNESDVKAPYLEIQVSPLNQPFALIITEPRKSFHAPAVLDVLHEVLVEGNLWTSTFKLSLPADLKGSHLYGGFFACLDHEPREYYALEPNTEQNPDFHRPELFLPLTEI